MFFRYAPCGDYRSQRSKRGCQTRISVRNACIWDVRASLKSPFHPLSVHVIFVASSEAFLSLCLRSIAHFPFAGAVNIAVSESDRRGSLPFLYEIACSEQHSTRLDMLSLSMCVVWLYLESFRFCLLTN